MKKNNPFILLALSSFLSFGPVTVHALTSHTVRPAGQKAVVIAHKSDDNGLALSIALFIVLYLIAVNTPPVRRWQMYRQMILNPVDKIPESDLDGLIIYPSVIAHANMAGIHGNLKEKISPQSDLQPQKNPVHRSTINSTSWYHRFFLKSDTGVIDHSAIDASPPWKTKKFFLLGERCILWQIFSLLPYGRLGTSSYCDSVDGSLYLLIVCPFFKVTRFGTLVPSKGFAVKISPNGFPEFLGIKEAQRTFPHACLFPAAVAKEYALAYSAWSAGFVGKFWKRIKSLQFFHSSLAELTSPKIGRYSGWGNQHTCFLGPDAETGGALNAVLFFDINSGRPKVFVREEGQIILGPLQALDAVRLHYGQKSDHKFDAPQLIIRNGELYWLVSVMFSKEKDSYALLGHYLYNAATGSLVPMVGGSTALLEQGVSAIQRTLPVTADRSQTNY